MPLPDSPAGPRYAARHADPPPDRGDGQSRAGCRAAITSKRSLDSYLHPAAIFEASGFSIAFSDDDDVPDLVARQSNERHEPAVAWEELTHRARKRLRYKAKRWLNTRAVEQMTAARLAERDPDGEVRSWLRRLRALPADEFWTTHAVPTPKGSRRSGLLFSYHRSFLDDRRFRRAGHNPDDSNPTVQDGQSNAGRPPTPAVRLRCPSCRACRGRRRGESQDGRSVGSVQGRWSGCPSPLPQPAKQSDGSDAKQGQRAGFRRRNGQRKNRARAVETTPTGRAIQG